MPFALHKMPIVRSFDEAKAFYEKAPQWVKVDPPRHGARKLYKNCKDYKYVRPVTDENRRTGYAFRYHDTDVVVWWSNDEFHIHGYESISTTAFMEALIPEDFSVYMNHPTMRLVGLPTQPKPVYPPDYDAPGYEAHVQEWRSYQDIWRGGLYWHDVGERDMAVLRDPATGKWSIPEASPIPCAEVDRAKAHAASRDHNLSGFTAWLHAIVALYYPLNAKLIDFQALALSKMPLGRAVRASGAGEHEHLHTGSDVGLQRLCEALREPELWWAIAASPNLRPPTRWANRGNRVIQRTNRETRSDYVVHLTQCCRIAVYREAGAVTVVNHPYLQGMHAITAARRAASRWRIDTFNWPEREATGYGAE